MTGLSFPKPIRATPLIDWRYWEESLLLFITQMRQNETGYLRVRIDKVLYLLFTRGNDSARKKLLSVVIKYTEALVHGFTENVSSAKRISYWNE